MDGPAVRLSTTGPNSTRREGRGVCTALYLCAAPPAHVKPLSG